MKNIPQTAAQLKHIFLENIGTDCQCHIMMNKAVMIQKIGTHESF